MRSVKERKKWHIMMNVGLQNYYYFFHFLLVILINDIDMTVKFVKNKRVDFFFVMST